MRFNIRQKAVKNNKNNNKITAKYYTNLTNPKKVEKNRKKGLTKGEKCGIINKLTEREQRTTVRCLNWLSKDKTERHSAEVF